MFLKFATLLTILLHTASCYQPISSGWTSSKELFRFQLVPGRDLVLRENDNPCSELIQYCMFVNVSSTHRCVHMYQRKMQKEILSFSSVMNQLDVDERLFMNCKETFPIYRKKDDFSHFYWEMLQVLQEAPSGDKQALKLFDLRRTEMRLNPLEEIDLYTKAVVLHPNSTFIISQFGLALMSYGSKALANALFSNAVERGLWPHILQRPEWFYIPKTNSKPWHNPNDYPFIRKLEAGYAKIYSELLSNLNYGKVAMADDISNKAAIDVDKIWTVMYLKHPGAQNFTAYSRFFTETVKIIQDCNTDFIEIKFSTIQPGTHIKPHTGPSNSRLRIHLTLIHTGGAKIRVGNEWRTWQEGKVIMFDSSWEHEVYHNGKDTRIVLILDIPNLN